MDDRTDTLRRLLDVGRDLLSELDSEAVLRRILEQARATTGARYAALGVLNVERTEIERFLTLGFDDETEQRLGDPPRGRGVLGVLINDPRPLRLRDVGSHERSFGFPPGHPAMASFLGVPISIRGVSWGTLYLTEKQSAEEFTEDDEDAAVILSEFAAIAIENARLYEQAERGRQDLSRAVRGLEAARSISDAISTDTSIDRTLELIVKRGRDLIDARTVVIMLQDGADLVVASTAGQYTSPPGYRIPIATSTAGEVLRHGKPARIDDVHRGLRIAPEEIGVTGAQTALLVPMIHRGEAVGILSAFDRGTDHHPFSERDEVLIQAFAASATNAVAISRSVESGRLRSAIAAADEERRRWARELHDGTLQSMGGIRLLLSSARSDGQPESILAAVGQVLEDLDWEIGNMRALITDLRPPMLDDLGLIEALGALIERRRADGLKINVHVDTPKLEAAGLSLELESTVYRVIQESLTNIVKHAHATAVEVTLGLSDNTLVVAVSDNGVGFDTGATTAGFGVMGIRERVYLVGGEMEIESDSTGTRTCVRVPIPDGSP